MNEKVLISLIGVAGALIGALSTLAGNWLIFWLKQRAAAEKDRKAKEILDEMLNGPHVWRSLRVLSHVIGAEEEATRQLLLQIGARASEDGQQKWALRIRAPFQKDTSPRGGDPTED